MIDKHLVALSESQDAAHTPKEHLEIAREWALLMASVGIAAAVIASLVTAAYVALAPAWIQAPLFVAAGFACVIATGVLRALGFARQAIAVRLYEFQENQSALREIARITATQVTNVSVRGRQNVVSVNSQGQAVESVRLVGVNMNRPVRMIDDVDERDLIFFCERVPLVGHSQRAWMGAKLPSGHRITTFGEYDKLLQPLCKAGLIIGRRERSAGQLVTNDQNELKRVLGLPAGTEGQETKDVTPSE